MKSSRKFIGLIAAVFFASAIGVLADSPPALKFLTLRPSSRAEALGGAMTASGDDLSALSINPATLSRLRRPEALFSQALLFEDTKFSYAGYAQPTRWGMPSFEYMALSYGDFDNISRDGTKLGTQSPKETFFGFGWSTKRYKQSVTGAVSEYRTGLFKDLDLGVNFRYFKSDLSQASASGLSMSFGALYKLPIDGLTTGLSVNHMGSPVKYANESHSQPRTVRMGLGYESTEFLALSSRARFSVDGVLPQGASFHPAVGAEISFANMITFQAGYAGEESLDSRFRFGLGMGFDAINLNYSAAPLGDLGTTHRISARMRFGQGVWNILSVLSGDQAVEDHLLRAQDNKQKGNPQRAALYANRVLKKRPENLEAKEILRGIEKSERAKMGAQLYSEAVALIRLGLFEDAEEKMKESLELDPSNESYKTIHATVARQIADRKQTETDALLASIRASNPEKAPAPQKPLPEIKAAAPEPEPVSQNLDPASQAEFERALGLIQARKLDEAIGSLRSVVEKNKGNFSASERLAYCLKGRGVKSYAKGMYQESYDDFKEAAGLNPKDPSLRKFLANVEQIMESLNLKPTVASYNRGLKGQ